MRTMGQPTRWDIEFYQDAHGRYPVREWLLTLDEKERARVARTIQLLETNGLRLSTPHTKHVQGKIWELRISSGRRDYRVFYCAASGRRFILLHAFLKKNAQDAQERNRDRRTPID
jgi:phage-related protein